MNTRNTLLPADVSGSWYIDTTSCCRSANNSGIQRVVRGLYQHLSEQHPVQPLVWDEFWGHYAAPTAGELRYLTNPFALAGHAVARPNQQGLNSREFLNKRWHHSQQSVPLRDIATNGLLLLPEVFRDSRILYLPRPAEIPIPVVAWFHDACALQLGSIVPEAKTRRFERYLRYLAECQAIITISHYSRQVFLDWCEAHAIPPPPVHVLPLPVEFPGTRVSSWQEPTQPRIQVLYVSSLTYNKNHLALFEACRELWDSGLEFDLQLVGKVDSAWAPTILPALEQLRVNYPVHWNRHVSDEALQDLYRQCHFTVYPSLCEGYGLPILESFWFAKPCLIPDSGAMREVAAEGGCHYFSHTTPGSLAASIRQLVTETALRQKLAQQASQKIFPQWIQYCQQLADILREMC